MWMKKDSVNPVNTTLLKCMSGSVDSLLEVENGARIYRSHHRPPPTILSSTTSSSASVATSGGSTTALIRPKKKRLNNNQVNLGKHAEYNKWRTMAAGDQKELNILISNPTVPDIGGEDKKPTGESLAQPINDVLVPLDPLADALPDARSKFMPQVLAALSVSLGSLVVGFSSAYTSPALVSMNGPNSTIHVSEQEASWIGSLMPLSALIGGMAGGPLIETIGRKTTIVSTGIPFILSFLLISFAVNVPMVMAGRSVGGFCVGIASLVLPVYLGETVQPEVRGSLGILPTILGNGGILICYFAGNYLDWSMLALLGACTPVPFLLSSLLIPETPRWYIAKNKPEKARKALQWLRGRDSEVQREFNEIAQLAQEQEKEESKTALKELFSKKYRRPILISLGLMFFQQMSGINAVIFYTVRIFQDAGSTIDENLCTIIVGTVNLASTILATFIIDRLGRKILLYMSSTSMFLTLMTLGTFFYYKNNGVDVSEYGWLPLVSFVIFVVGFSIGFGPIPWLMMGEILPAKIRGSAASVVTGFNWACTFLVTKTFIDVMLLLGTHGAFWLFGAFCFVALFFVIIFVPETQGKSLEDIERNLTGGGKGPIRSQRRHSSIANLKVMPNSM